MKIEQIEIEKIKPYENNPRNNDGAVDATALSISRYGFRVPIVIDANNVIICGHTRYKAAQKLGLRVIPCERADDLTPEQVREYRLADNKTAEIAEWDFSKLEEELSGIDYDMSAFGFDEIGEIEEDEIEITEDELPEIPEDPQTEPGQMFSLGQHRLICGDCTKLEILERLSGGGKM